MSIKVYKDGKLQQVAGNTNTKFTRDDLIDILGYTPASSDGSNSSGEWDIDITGNSSTATKATQDGSGNVITDTYATKEEIIPNNDTVASYEVGKSGTGWYRIAKFASNSNESRGSTANSCQLFIKRVYSNNNNEYHEVKLSSVYGKSKLVSGANLSNEQYITNIRHTVDTTSNVAYIEIYYTSTEPNPVTLIINNGRCIYNKYWECIEPEFTEETVDGVIVYSKLNIPVNATSELKADLKEYDVPLTDDSYGDFNNYLDIGIYVFNKNVGMTNTSNTPTTKAGTLVVTDYTGVSKSMSETYAYRVQEFHTHDNSGVYKRSIQSDGASKLTVGEWVKDVVPSDIAKTYLPLSGGTLTGQLTMSGSTAINFGGNNKILFTGNDCAGLNKYNNLDIRSWNGVSFSTLCAGYTGSTVPAVSIDCRNGKLYTASTIYEAGVALSSRYHRNYTQTIDLSNTSVYDPNTWYPCTGTAIPSEGFQRIKVAVHLDSGTKPSWSTHAGGFSCALDLETKANGWGATNGSSIVYDSSYNYTTSMPVTYSQMGNSSTPVLWCRGGGKYPVRTTYNVKWTPRTSAYTISSQTVKPTTTAPSTSITRSTIHANLSGNATSATKLATSRTLTIGNTGKAFNGEVNVSWSLSEIGAAAKSHTHSYLPLTGGTITADSNNSTYGKAAINIANKTSGSSTIFPAISFMQLNVSDANLVMKNSYFYRKTGSSTTYSRIYDSGNNTVDTYDSAAIGTDNTLSGNLPLKFAFGGNNTLTGGYGSAAIGTQCKVKGQHAIATGDYSESNAWCTVAMGDHVLANGAGQTVFGHFNVSNTSGSTAGTTGNALIVGNGTSGTARSNAFRVTYAGLTYAKGAYSSTGADYAEYFEWEDGNPNNEDRRGLFVTFASGNKIRIANTDEYILGVVSGKPVIIGNTDDDEQWAQRFLKDEYGEFIKQQFKQEREVKVIDEETGEEKTEIVTEDIEFYVENPDYDPSKEYVTREHRPEWSPIGMLGVLSVRDDGTCVVNGYCKCSDGGIATASEISTYSYRVIERVTDNIVKVVLK